MALSTGAIVGLVAAGAAVLLGGIYLATRTPTPPTPPPETVTPYAQPQQPAQSEAASIVSSVATVATSVLGRVLPDRNADAQRAHELEIACISHPDSAVCRQRDAARALANTGGATRDAASAPGNGQASSRDASTARTN